MNNINIKRRRWQLKPTDRKQYGYYALLGLLVGGIGVQLLDNVINFGRPFDATMAITLLATMYIFNILIMMGLVSAVVWIIKLIGEKYMIMNLQHAQIEYFKVIFKKFFQELKASIEYVKTHKMKFIILIGSILVILRLSFPVLGHNSPYLNSECRWNLFQYDEKEYYECPVELYRTYSQVIIIILITVLIYWTTKKTLK